MVNNVTPAVRKPLLLIDYPFGNTEDCEVIHDIKIVFLKSLTLLPVVPAKITGTDGLH